MASLRLRTTKLAGWLALVLLVCQALAQWHATQHRSDATGVQPSCEICVYAHGAGVLPGAVHLPLLVLVEARLLIVAPPGAILELWTERPRARAPPVPD